MERFPNETSMIKDKRSASGPDQRQSISHKRKQILLKIVKSEATVSLRPAGVQLKRVVK